MDEKDVKGFYILLRLKVLVANVSMWNKRLVLTYNRMETNHNTKRAEIKWRPAALIVHYVGCRMYSLMHYLVHLYKG